MKKLLFLVAVVAGFLSSCGDDEISRDPDSIGYQYYPLEVGRYWIFNVTENKYVNNAKVETTTHQTREEIDAIVKDQTGKEWYRVELSRRPDASANWVISGVRLVSLSANNLQIQENNQTTVQMVFPVKNGYSFVANGFQDQENPVYFTYAALGKAFSQDGLSYDNTLTLVKLDEDTEVVFDKSIEVLALNSGPVYRSEQLYDYCDDSTGETCPYAVDYIVSGSDRTEILESTGLVQE
ncbi:hypothetical protein [Rufibacter psychrotolerans]|uniref:hypothetical protein n=1 Tax=Rufibacter psychrotolerans TaxID=2812556 RepID=UPI001967C1A5|nr:hypothetical protein [Rufibacter sp. SYSU D00308]